MKFRDCDGPCIISGIARSGVIASTDMICRRDTTPGARGAARQMHQLNINLPKSWLLASYLKPLSDLALKALLRIADFTRGLDALFMFY